MKSSVCLALLASTASALYAGNLNYLSPSLNHDSLGISLPKVVKRNTLATTIDPATLNFTHGVASGDPYEDSVILWTRVAPIGSDNDKSNVTVSGFVPLYDHDNAAFVAVSLAPICVSWTVYTAKDLKTIVSSGTVYTSSDVDYTVKVEAENLAPFTQYFYQFAICGSKNVSPVGSTKTIPAADGRVPTPIRLAVYSCSNYPFGFFNAFGNPVRKQSVDYMIHLGDYIYEYKNGDYGWGNSYGRIPQPDKEVYSLYDYRKRIAQYRTDLDLVAAHQAFPWIQVWDDHEVADNTFRDGSSELNNTESSFIGDGGVSVDQRKTNAVRAYFEWMPIRQVAMDDNLRIWRSFAFGDLFDLIMLDTRQYDRSITDLYWNTDYVHAISNDNGRSLMGSAQENWFFNSLKTSAHRATQWRVIGNQIVFSRLNQSIAYGDVDPLDYDAWDGYLGSKNRTLNTLYSNNISNTVFLAGDSHASWASDLVWLDDKPYDPVSGTGSIGVEFAGSAVSSPCPYGQNITLSNANKYTAALVAANRELQWNDLYYRGYYELSIGYDAINATYFGLPSLKTRNGFEIPMANFTVRPGENKLHRGANGLTAPQVDSGSLKGTSAVVGSNLTHDTNTNTWFVYKGQTSST